ncbi:HEAT repeat domain-containing protein [Phycicoccus avicenniae]|uniref:HEAT repeat domain-containing protein n=1 Tax=Phycicoccus avicenniae TaxID=2828860 RepID=UPI003D28F18F
MATLPPEDQPDVLRIGPIAVPIIEDDDPRYLEDQAAWSSARRAAQALHTWDELEGGTRHADWRVRCEAIVRLAARWPDHPGTLSRLLALASADAQPEVRGTAVMRLVDFPTRAVQSSLEVAAFDTDPDVRWSANYALHQHGLPFDEYWTDG